MIIDDDPSIVRFLKTILSKEYGQRVELTTLTDSRDASAAIDRIVPDVVLTDLEMPGVGGLELLSDAKKRNPWAQVFVITGHSSMQALLGALDYGATDYLLKPIDREILTRLLDQAFERVDRWRAAMHSTLSLTR